ncbi:MAG: molybdopterin-guanine dinucleotide biosynthesis protein MobB, partial [Proteobacteria bacterium]|nr:molybdopterin-guanine dinucleotide biosynthesis protein MobB [Pseudomonadota bacterium]
LDVLLTRLAPVDLVLVEGFKRDGHDKIEIHRPSLGKPLLAGDDPHIVAVASDAPVVGLRVPLLSLDDISGIADLVMTHVRPPGAA